MEQRKDIPAFPLAFQKQVASGMPRTETYTHHGMALRDYFAAKAMPVVIAEWNKNDPDSWDSPELKERMARIAYSFADAMLSAREAYQPDQSCVDTSMWDACNPGCDPEFNGSKDRHCSCEPAKAAMLAVREK